MKFGDEAESFVKENEERERKREEEGRAEIG